MKILLVGNYLPDKQESMQRFAELLERELSGAGHDVKLLRPQTYLNTPIVAQSKLGKWVGYVDKFLLWPRALRKQAPWADVIHVCDHSNSIYIKTVARFPHVITCHDMLAIRSGLGLIAENPTGWSGRIFQKLILKGLSRARYISCVSENSRQELLDLISVPKERVSVIYNGLNYPYAPTPQPELETHLHQLFSEMLRNETEAGQRPRYILHVGGNQWYKNRLGVLKIYAHYLSLCEARPAAPILLMAGKAFTKDMRDFVQEQHLDDKVISIQGTSNEQLRALYSGAELLLFPSLSEGFGWPIIEAQACGCPVMTSDLPPMNEIAGAAAVLCHPENIPECATLLKSIVAESGPARAQRVRQGLDNAEHFSTQRMIEGYIAFYQEIACPPEASAIRAEGAH